MLAMNTNQNKFSKKSANKIEYKKTSVWKNIKILIFCQLAVFLIISSSQAKELYVDSQAGNDSVSYTDNNANNPWRTIGRAAWGSTNRSSMNSSEAAQAGDTVHVAAGTYTTSGLSNWETDDRFHPVYETINSGTSDNPITFQAENPASTSTSGYSILETGPQDGDRLTGQPTIGTWDQDYIIWDGFYIDEADCDTHADTGPVTILGSTGVTIKNCRIIGYNVSWSDNHNGIRAEGTDDTTIQNNLIYGFEGNYGDNETGIMTYASLGLLIEHNTIYDSGSGIFLKGKDDTTEKMNNGTVRYNEVYSCYKGLHFIYSKEETYVYQNIIRDCTNGLEVHTYGDGYPRNNWFVNNTIDNSTTRSIYVHLPYSAYDSIDADLLFQNNIVNNSNDRAIAPVDSNIGTTADYEFDYNCYYTYSNFTEDHNTFSGWQTDTSQDTNSINSNPHFTDEGNNDFTLQAGSPCEDAGVDVLDLDNDGDTSDPINLGAYVNGNEAIGLTTNINSDDDSLFSSLSAPTSLQIIN